MGEKGRHGTELVGGSGGSDRGFSGVGWKQSDMPKATLLLGDASHAVAELPLVTNCILFRNNLTLAASPYRVNSSVRLEVFRLFLEAVEGKEIQITKQNVADLSQLCTEFGFESLSRKISAFLNSPDCASADAEARARISGLEKRVLQQDGRIASLEAELGRVHALAAIVSQMQMGFARFTAEVQTALAQLRAAPPVQQQPPPAPPPLDSRIVASLPSLLDEFRGKRFVLLCRGSRDGFGVQDFHGRCDGRANTLTLILDTDGNVFGGFTPLQWESPGDYSSDKCDDSLKSFLFTLKNPHNIPARKFALRAEWKQCAIHCQSSRGPVFGDILVYDNCNAHTDSFTWLGVGYTNDTGPDGETVFTGSADLQVREIEVFEIPDETTLPNVLLGLPRFCADRAYKRRRAITQAGPHFCHRTREDTTDPDFVCKTINKAGWCSDQLLPVLKCAFEPLRRPNFCIRESSNATALK
jgi:uncharacterized coiled-coil protein SlyX